MFECDMMEKEKASPKRADIWFLLGILAAALILLLLFRINRTQGSYAEVSCDGVVLVKIPLSQTEPVYYLITGHDTGALKDGAAEAGMEDMGVEDSAMENSGMDNSEIHTTSPFVNIQELSEAEWSAMSQTESAHRESFYNIILCRDGEVQMIESDCPDLICVRHRAVRSTGENIICLPHKIVVEVTGAEESDLDGVVY